MNRIYLDKLCEFTTTTYKNYQVVKEKDWNFDQHIEIIKQNISLNEKGIINKFDYIELNWLIPNIEQNELVLIYPLCFNIVEYHEWINLLNAMLIVLNDEYLYKPNVQKKLIIDTFDKTFKKKINIQENLTDDLLEKIAKTTNITLIILSFEQNQIYNKKENNEQKYLVLVKNKNEYFPVLNWTTKFYKYSDYFIQYLIEFINLTNKENINKKQLDQTNIKNQEKNIIQEYEELVKPKIKKIKSNVSIKEDFDENNKPKSKSKPDDKPNEFYEEVINNNENYALYISEAIDNKDKNKDKDILSSTSKKNDEAIKKKLKKNSKDIFVSNKNINDKQEKQIVKEKDQKDNEQNNKLIIEDSVFAPTEKITKNDIDNIKLSLKSSLALPDLQAIAIKLSISIVSGATKTGKPKNKTKSELFESIEKYIKDFE